jgi:hypothetical protein
MHTKTGFSCRFPGAFAAAARRRRSMAGKGGGKSLVAAKIAAGMDKDKKSPVNRSACAGLHVTAPPLSFSACLFLFRS